MTAPLCSRNTNCGTARSQAAIPTTSSLEIPGVVHTLADETGLSTSQIHRTANELRTTGLIGESMEHYNYRLSRFTDPNNRSVPSPCR
jgi:hypothetical protein